MRKFMLGCIGCLAVTLFASASSLAAGPVDSCLLTGTVNFEPGLNSSEHQFSYTIGGALSDCNSSETGAPESGTLEAGQTLTEQVTNSITGATDTVAYQEWPVPTGGGTCANNLSTGRALVTWADGTHTVELYSMQGALASVLLAEVAPSMTLKAVNAQEGDPVNYTIKTSPSRALTLDGLVAILPSDPTACNTSTGVTTAGFSGALGFGAPSALGTGGR